MDIPNGSSSVVTAPAAINVADGTGPIARLPGNRGSAVARLARAIIGIIATVGVLIGICSAKAVSAANGELKAINFSVNDQRTRIILTLTKPVEHDAFALPGPYRTVIDLPNVRWRAGVASPPPNASLVRTVRHGTFQQDVLRLVLDSSAPVRIARSSLTTDGNMQKLTIDLVPARLTAKTGTANVGNNGGNNARSSTGNGADKPSRAFSVAATSAVAKRPNKRQSDVVGPNKRVVVIDAGHGGADPGAISNNGVLEKRVTLAAARAIRDELRRGGRYRVVLTRDRDHFIPLRRRIAIARTAKADLFISIHADKMDNRSVRGLSVYTLSERASDAEAAALAERENKADLIADIDLRNQSPEVANILIGLAQRYTMNRSAQLATVMVRELRAETLLLPKTHRFAGFAVLKAPDVPSVLVEMGYLSNPQDEAMLRDPAHRKSLAEAIRRSIDSYFSDVQRASLL